MAKKRKLDYRIMMPQYDVNTYADGEALRKIFSNLLSNAVKYASQKATVRFLPIERTNNMIVIEFENDGYVIPPEMEERIFEPFRRLKRD